MLINPDVVFFTGEDIVELVLWCLGDKDHSPLYITKPVLQVVDLVIKHFLVNDRHLLGNIYEVFFNHLSNTSYSETLVSILLQLTTRAEINRRRCRIVRSIGSKGGACSHVNSLLWRFRQLRPDLEPKVPPPSKRPSVPTSLIFKRFANISNEQCEQMLSGLGWDPSQLSSKIVYKDSMKECLLPLPDYINLQGGMESKMNAKVPLLAYQEVDDAFEHLEQIDLPNNILSVIGTKVAPNILPRKELIERFSLVLYHTLQKEFLTLPRSRSKRESERRKKRQVRLLEVVQGFQVHCYHGLPIVGR